MIEPRMRNDDAQGLHRRRRARPCRHRRAASEQPVERPRGFAGGFRRRLRALRRALSVEEVAAAA